MQPFRIIIADDHNIVRRALRCLLENCSDLAVAAEVGDGEQLLYLLDTMPADLVLLDLSMPRCNGFEACRAIRHRHPHVKVLVLTMHRHADFLARAMAAGAHGYMLKEDSDTELFDAIAALRSDRVYLSPGIAPAGTTRSATGPAELTSRERDVICLVAQGKTSREIARHLDISVRTVENHRANMMKKLHVHTTAQLINFACQSGYLASCP